MQLIITLTIIWIVLIFIALPIGIKVPIEVAKGHADSAPEKHALGLKLSITFAIALLLSTSLYYFEWLSFA